MSRQLIQFKNPDIQNICIFIFKYTVSRIYLFLTFLHR